MHIMIEISASDLNTATLGRIHIEGDTLTDVTADTTGEQ